MQLGLDLPVHDDPVWDVDALDVLVVVLGVGEQVQTVARPVVFDLPSHRCFRGGFWKGSGP